MDEAFLTLPVDLSVTPYRAKERGYRWCLDVGRDTPTDLVDEIILLIKEQGYILGKPSFNTAERGEIPDRGLYAPLDRVSGRDSSSHFHSKKTI